MSPVYHLTRVSSNAKTGPIPVSTTSSQSCAIGCPLSARNGGGCYADSGPLALHWKAVDAGERGGSLAEFVDAIQSLPVGQVWRHNQAGDLPGDGETIAADALAAIVKANRRKRGFTYTHHELTPHNGAAIRDANDNGFTVNLSANNLADADTLADTGYGPVTVVLPSDHTDKVTYTPQGRRVVTCPAARKDSGVSCATCGAGSPLCSRAWRDYVVGFPAHGTQKRKASAVARGEA